MPPTNAPKKSVPVALAKVPKKARGSKTADDDFEEWKKARALAKPPDQVELCDAELKEMLPRLLQTINVQHPDSLVEYSFSLSSFVPIPIPGNYVLVYSQKGTYLHKDTDEARKQMQAQGIEFAEGTTVSAQPSVSNVGEEQPLEEQEGEEEEGEQTEGGEQTEEGKGEGEGDEAVRPAAGKKLPNQFNFCERAALTYNNPSRAQGTQTSPAPKGSYSDNVLQWIIYDGYQKDYEEQQLELEKERERREQAMMSISKHKPPPKKIAGKAQLSEAVQGRVYECWKTLERMINQNTYVEMAKDYRYWEDPADEFREEEGTLLPLWKFTYAPTKRNTVTDICWNPHYYDLFAVCFGFLDFMKPIPGGAICFFTLKTSSFPDYVCVTESGVMCVDIHKQYPYMVLIGLYDGNVMVYNIQATCKQPAYTSNPVLQKHDDIVWEVKWVPNMPDGELNFYSVSSDGKVKNWVLMQSEFAVTTIIDLRLEKVQVRGPDGTLVAKRSCASCLTFHPNDPHVYLVGTEEGLIYKCSTAYCSGYLLTYKAHHLPVYRIDFNKFNSNIFASCSGDWRIKIWEDNRLEPLYVFDLGSCVGDIQWAPYSSTVLGAVTSKGAAYLFDLNVNKHKPICEQQVVSRKKCKLTRIAFNQKMPIIICSDDKGCVTTLKLSPNLRLACKPPKKQQHLDQRTLHIMKLDKLLSLVREPITLNRPPDPVSSGGGGGE